MQTKTTWYLESNKRSKSGMPNEVCTELCDRLGTLRLVQSTLPLHDDIVSALEFTRHDQQHGRRLGTLKDIRKRTHCPFCRLVRAAIYDAPGAAINDSIENEQVINVFLFPGEHSFRLSYPSRLGTRLAFVAEDTSRVNSPDSARCVHGATIQPLQILQWLDRCKMFHADTCCRAPWNMVRIL